jgi:peptidoglycan/LPS O-acetylase OafA/YrhL
VSSRLAAAAAPRSLLVDGLKILAAQLIVLHHIVLYAPMADLLSPAWPSAAAFLVDEARFVVQIFLVIGGFLAAQGLARRRHSLPRSLLARYLRLVPMLAVALLAVLAASALLPRGGWPDWVTPWPTVGAFVAHLLLLQDLLHLPSLSAGAWYVSIDFQLYALLAIGATAWHRSDVRPVWGTALPWAVALLAVASGGDGRGQALVALAQAGQARVGLAVTCLEVGLAAPADVHLRARHHRLGAGPRGRPRGGVLSLCLTQPLSGFRNDRCR